jgi:2,5-furandicarboxylate decarboxylase 1
LHRNTKKRGYIMVHGLGNWVCYDDLKDLVGSLREDNDLVEIAEEVSPRYEVGAILGALGEEGGPAALFTNVAGFPGKPIAGNILGHRRRLAKAFGVKDSELSDAFLERKVQRIAPVEVQHTPAVTLARDPERGHQSMGLHRIQVRSERSLGIYLATPPLSHFLQRAWEMEKALEVAVVIGPDPAVLVGSVIWCPDGYDKLDIAGGLRQKAVEVVACDTVDLRVPAYSQYVIEGRIEPGDVASEGTFGESSGIYAEGDKSPVIRVAQVSHREAPLYQALQTWSAEDDALLNLCYGSVLLADLRKEFPFVRDLHIITGTVCAHVIVSVSSHERPMIRSAISAALTRNPFVKMVIAVSEDIDIRNHREVEWAVATRFQADRDLILIPGLQGSVIDPSASADGSSCKIGMDATYPKEREKSYQKIAVPAGILKRAREIVDNVSSGFRKG